MTPVSAYVFSVSLACAIVAQSVQVGAEPRPMPRPAPVAVNSASDRASELGIELGNPDGLLAKPRPRARDLAPKPRFQTPEQGVLMAARAGYWTQAERLARTLDNPAAETLVDWMRLRRGDGQWAEYQRFLDTHGDWPGQSRLRSKAEGVLPAGLPTGEVIGFFADALPTTGAGSLRYALALRDAGQNSEAEAEAVRAWRAFEMTPAEQSAYLRFFGPVLAPHHLARLDHLLWQGDGTAARRMLPLVSEEWALLAEARLRLRNRSGGVDTAIAAVPEALTDHPGLAYERFVWRARKGRTEEALEIINARSGSAAALGQPDAWASRRRSLARQLMRLGNARDAYRLASRHHLQAGADFADLEWLAGFIALTRLNDPETAARHFRALEAAVSSPISRGRAGYWLGRAEAAAGNPEAALAAYRRGGAHQTSFYGQLAAHRADMPADPALGKQGKLGDWRNAGFLTADPMLAARVMEQAGETGNLRWFMLHLADALPPQDRAALAQYALDQGHTYVALRIGKSEARQGRILPAAYYPVTSLADHPGPVAPELALAVARQESEMNPGAVSPAGARGLMQLMPRTAQSMARTLGLGYSLNRLTSDPDYNARLGTAYLARMLQRYDGSVALAAAAYNAGPGRVDRWLTAYGDPRDPAVDLAEWIETIPFRETRNYVMRVMEGAQVYRARIGGKPVALNLHTPLGDAS